MQGTAFVPRRLTALSICTFLLDTSQSCFEQILFEWVQRSPDTHIHLVWNRLVFFQSILYDLLLFIPAQMCLFKCLGTCCIQPSFLNQIDCFMRVPYLVLLERISFTLMLGVAHADPGIGAFEPGYMLQCAHLLHHTFLQLTFLCCP